MKKTLLVAGIILAVLIVCFRARQLDRDKTATSSSEQFKQEPTNTAARPTARERPKTNEGSGDPYEKKTEEIRIQAVAGFNKLLDVLQPYGSSDGVRDSAVQRRTNKLGGVNIEVEMRSGTHTATFRAGPINPTNGVHINPFLPDGALLNLFASLYDGSDTRRNPEANKSWYQSTGTWTEQEAVSETFRLMEQLDIPTNQVVSHKFHGSSVGVEDLSGNKVRVTPFYTVQMSKDAADEDNSFLNVEYRIDQNPPGKVTRLFCWPPVKVP